MSTASTAQATQAWLRSSRQVQVPMTWLEACVEWIFEENGGAAMSQAQLNQHVLDQWLLTDLRDLAHPVLPAGISEAQKTELNGCYCVQVDSLLDVSQPAYTQLQRHRGSDCSNEQVSAVTQATQKPWEAKPTRMLMLQLTDGVQCLEGMEYQPVPALSASLRPGAKLQLSGRIVCRLGVLLLKSENVKVMGGEVEELMERNFQGRVLCRTLGLPEEDPQREGEQDDEELLVSLENMVENQMAPRAAGSLDSGFESLGSRASLGLEPPYSRHSEPSWMASNPQTPPNHGGNTPSVVEIPDEDFDDIPLDELDDVIFDQEFPPELQDSPNTEVNSVQSVIPRNQTTVNRSAELIPHSASVHSATQESEPLEEMDILPNDLDCFFPSEPQPSAAQSVSVKAHSSMGQEPSLLKPKDHPTQELREPSTVIPSPWTYLCVLQANDWPPSYVREVRMYAFIVTLLGNLQSNGGTWKIGATISDGTGYLDADLSDGVLASLIGFSAAEARTMRKDPGLRGQVEAGMLKCQRALVDMCCVMTVRFDPAVGRAVVLEVDDVSERDRSELERRVRGRKT